MTPLKIAITPGEPAGVGPDLVIELAQQEWPAQLVIFADETMMQERAAALNMPLKLTPYTQITVLIHTRWVQKGTAHQVHAHLVSWLSTLAVTSNL